MILQFALVGLGGAIGSMLRYGTTQLFLRFIGEGFPWATLCINILGSLGIGILFGALSQIENNADNLKLFMVVGILGGFTTFSAFSLDTILLFERGQYIHGLLYIIASVGLSILAALSGLLLIRATLS